jgi:preprotein translocase subunit SecF
MKYTLKEHPMIILLALALIMLACSIVLGVYKSFSIYSIVAIVISGLATLFLGYSFIADLMLFEKEKKKSQDQKHDSK